MAKISSDGRSKTGDPAPINKGPLTWNEKERTVGPICPQFYRDAIPVFKWTPLQLRLANRSPSWVGHPYNQGGVGVNQRTVRCPLKDISHETLNDHVFFDLRHTYAVRIGGLV